MRPRPMKPTLIMNLCKFKVESTFYLDELPLDPLQLARDVVDDVARLEVRGQHVPGVGLDLEMRGERGLLVDGERLFEREAGRAEGAAEIGEKDRHMEMRAPFARPGILVEGLERVLEVQEPGHLPVFLLTGLREVDRLREGLQGVHGLLR